MASDSQQGLRVGITGGIGSGKSTVCQIFGALGVPVYDADSWAKWLIVHDPDIVEGIKRLFGPAAYNDTGEYNRTFVAQIVFSDPGKLAALNSLVHPAVEAHSVAWHKQQIAAGHPYTIKEAALLIESSSYKRIDFLIVVAAPEALRIERVMKRNGVSADQVRARMQHQMPEADKILLADAVIHNDKKSSLLKQVWALHQQLLGAKKTPEP